MKMKQKGFLVYELKFHKQVIKFLQNQPLNFRKKVLEQFEIIKNNPFDNNLDIKELKGMKNFFRLRISKYRFIYRIENNILLIEIVKAGSRGDIYK